MTQTTHLTSVGWTFNNYVRKRRLMTADSNASDISITTTSNVVRADQTSSLPSGNEHTTKNSMSDDDKENGTVEESETKAREVEQVPPSSSRLKKGQGGNDTADLGSIKGLLNGEEDMTAGNATATIGDFKGIQRLKYTMTNFTRFRS